MINKVKLSLKETKNEFAQYGNKSEDMFITQLKFKMNIDHVKIVEYDLKITETLINKGEIEIIEEGYKNRIYK